MLRPIVRPSHLAASCALATALWGCATAHDPEPPSGKADDPAADAASPVADEPDADVITVTDAAPPDDASTEVDAAVEEEEPPCQVSAQLLENGDFDDGPGGMWTETSGGYDPDGNPTVYALVRALPAEVGTHSGAFGAWLGGYIPPQGITAEDALVQEMVVPAGVTGLVLTGSAYIQSAEIFSGADDTMTVELLDDQDQLIETVGTLSNLHENRAWDPFEAELGAAALAGKTVRLRFRGSFDADQITNFFLDTVAVTVTACQ